MFAIRTEDSSAFRERGFRAIEAVVTDGTEDSAAEIERLRDKVAQLEERVRQLDSLAHQDVLLPIPNRRGFLRELESLIGRVSRYGESAAMLFVDIDGLKRINDSFGHKAGDQALGEVARALTEGVRKSDCVARLGGDEFGVLLAHATQATARDTAERLAERIEAAQILCDGNPLKLGVAVGVTMIDGGDTPDMVIARADCAMYEEKSAAA
ncbi:MAG TPA: GGDEF domain-containing protein [Sphingomicrobium sp.]|nr:GGDEF domain-containing protein [Sphingomicrobium sp.]